MSSKHQVIVLTNEVIELKDKNSELQSKLDLIEGILERKTAEIQRLREIIDGLNEEIQILRRPTRGEKVEAKKAATPRKKAAVKE